MEIFRTRTVAFAAWLCWAWTVMTLTHELGHVVGGTITGGSLRELEIRPWFLPHSHITGDRFALITLWAGPVLGCAVPLFVAAIFRRPLLWFVAWFCVVANASYLLLAYVSGEAQLDTARIIAAGTPGWCVLTVSAIVLVIGYAKFRRHYVAFFRKDAEPNNARKTATQIVIWVAVVVVQAVIGSIIR